MKIDLPEPANVLFRIKRGLAGYISYLAACEMNASFSEYLLYEPILRILTARGYRVKCEYPCRSLSSNNGGNFKRIDFRATKAGRLLALEVKWAKQTSINIAKDHEKLACFLKENSAARCFLCVFGRRSHIAKLTLNTGSHRGRFRSFGQGVYADFRKTRFGCRVYELKRQGREK